jgi:hypothetical protein
MIMTTTATQSFSLNSVIGYLQSLEQSALASSDPNIKAFGAAVSNMLTAGEDVISAARAIVPATAAMVVNAGIGALATAEPVFGILVPAETIIDPAVSGLAGVLENILLPTISTSTLAAVSQTVPQPVAE